MTEDCTRDVCANRATPGVADRKGNPYCIACAALTNREVGFEAVLGIEAARALRGAQRRARRGA